MSRRLALTLVLSLLVPPVVAALPVAASVPGVLGQTEAAENGEGRSLGHAILLYLPNRVFDVLDLVRLRVRVGPGLAVGARATKPLTLFAGAYTSFYVGLRGPRGKPELPLPFGGDSRSAVQVSVADEGSEGPYYGPLEVGAGFQALILGLDLGVCAWEAVDLLGGVVGLDPQGDDL